MSAPSWGTPEPAPTRGPETAPEPGPERAGTGPRPRRPVEEIAAAALVAVHRAMVASGRQPAQTTVKWGRPPVVSLIIGGTHDDDVAHALSIFDTLEVDDAEVGEPFGDRTRLVQVTGYVPALGVFLEILAHPS